MESHRSAVRDATMDATAELVAAHGLSAVTMSQIAKETGIGRATLYKYFPDIEAILVAWHERHVAAHLAQLTEIKDRAGDPVHRLEAVLLGFAQSSRGSHDAELAAMLHRSEHVSEAERQLHQLIRDLVAESIAAGLVRNDIPATELAAYCLHALTAANNATSGAATQRLVTLTLAGLRPPA